MLGSVVIPAFNEEKVIGRCLESLLMGPAAAELEVVVACNGCSDDTGEVARGYPVKVIEVTAASKPAALRAGEATVSAMPRLYLDADVVLDGVAALRILERLRRGALAARPPAHYETAQCSRLVRSYFRARERVPAVNSALWGAGVYGLSELGRSRFGAFPDVVADDLWVDRHFRAGEVEIVDCEPVRIEAPRTARALLYNLRRTYRGKAERRPETPIPAETAGSTLRDLAASTWRHPETAIDALVYASFAVGGRLALNAAVSPTRWERDESSREG